MNNWVVKESSPLTQEEMENNVEILWNFFGSKGWTANAVAALAANMEAESTINPGRWESDIVGRLDYGFGLVGWTPATRFRNWVNSYYDSTDYTNGDYQMERIIWEMDNNEGYYPTRRYPETFKEWSESEKAPGYLAEAFLINYEKPADQSQAVKNFRASLAAMWYEIITGLPAPHYFNLPVWLLFKFKKGVL